MKESSHPAPRLFISYQHKQIAWVKSDLIPLLEAGGAEVIVDFRKFKAGRRVAGQMDRAQKGADYTVCVLTPAYGASSYCMHELNNAVAMQEEGHRVLPVVREPGAPTECLGEFNAILRVDLTDTGNDEQWQLLFDSCNISIGTSPVQWLRAREDIKLYLSRGISVNLVVAGKNIAWRDLLKEVAPEAVVYCKPIDLASGSVNSRRAFIEEMLRVCGIEERVPRGKEDLVVLDREITRLPQQHILVFTHFDMVKEREWYKNLELFAALRNLTTEKRKLVLLIQSRQHFVHLLPRKNPLSSISNLVTVELKGRE